MKNGMQDVSGGNRTNTAPVFEAVEAVRMNERE